MKLKLTLKEHDKRTKAGLFGLGDVLIAYSCEQDNI
jgi:hypothetical protein